MMKPAYRRELVKHLQVAWGVSARRACSIVGVPRSSLYYRHKRDTQAVLRQRIREIAETRIRFGYRRIHVLLRREGWSVNAKRVHRLYSLEGLQLRNKTPKRKVSAKLRCDRKLVGRQNEVWAMDFMSDQLFDGTKLRILTIVDARRSYKADEVVSTLERVTRKYGIPKEIRVDNGPEFVSRALDLWVYMNGVELDFSRPGMPTDNAFVESFNGKFRAECLNTAWFLSLTEAQAKCGAWRKDYNEVRPHSSIGHQTPAELIFASGQACLA
jgi:putative transposase